MATLYFNAAVDNDWNTLGNWWTNSGHTTAAGSLPGSGDDVVLSASVLTNAGSSPTIVNLTFVGTGTESIEINFTATGNVTLTDVILGAYPTGAKVVIANVEMLGAYTNWSEIVGNATFRGTGVNRGLVTGNAVFYDSTSNFNGANIITGDATFNGASFNEGVVNGNATFNGTSYTYGLILGSAVFNDYTQYNDPTHSGGSMTFNDFSYAFGPVVTVYNSVPSVTFNDNAFCANFPVFYLEVTFNDHTYGSLDCAGMFINGPPIKSNYIGGGFAGGPRFSFTRRSGINGSSILGVV